MKMRRTVSQIGIIGLVCIFSLANGLLALESSDITGIYELIEVNGKRLPATAWIKQGENGKVNSETRSGILLLSSEGKWAALVIEQDINTSSEDSKALPHKSNLFTGFYNNSGNKILFLDEKNEELFTGVTKGNEITIKVVGIGDLEGQTTEYLVRKK